LKTFLTATSGKSNSVARAVSADILGEEVFWDWDGWFNRSLLDD